MESFPQVDNICSICWEHLPVLVIPSIITIISSEAIYEKISVMKKMREDMIFFPYYGYVILVKRKEMKHLLQTVQNDFHKKLIYSPFVSI